jgi:hypothetical protein
MHPSPNFRRLAFFTSLFDAVPPANVIAWRVSNSADFR